MDKKIVYYFISLNIFLLSKTTVATAQFILNAKQKLISTSTVYFSTVKTRVRQWSPPKSITNILVNHYSSVDSLSGCENILLFASIYNPKVYLLYFSQDFIVLSSFLLWKSIPFFFVETKNNSRNSIIWSSVRGWVLILISNYEIRFDSM